MKASKPPSRRVRANLCQLAGARLAESPTPPLLSTNSHLAVNLWLQGFDTRRLDFMRWLIVNGQDPEWRR